MTRDEFIEENLLLGASTVRRLALPEYCPVDPGLPKHIFQMYDEVTNTMQYVTIDDEGRIVPLDGEHY